MGSIAIRTNPNVNALPHIAIPMLVLASLAMISIFLSVVAKKKKTRVIQRKVLNALASIIARVTLMKTKVVHLKAMVGGVVVCPKVDAVVPQEDAQIFMARARTVILLIILRVFHLINHLSPSSQVVIRVSIPW
jgi:hypothetical protein